VLEFAGVVCRRPGRRTRLIFRMLVHHGRKGSRALVWDNTHHVNATMRELIAARIWLTGFRFPS
jgi:putative transposase